MKTKTIIKKLHKKAERAVKKVEHRHHIEGCKIEDCKSPHSGPMTPASGEISEIRKTETSEVEHESGSKGIDFRKLVSTLFKHL